MYEKIQRIKISIDLESDQATQLVSIISDLFSPYNIPIGFSGVTLDIDSKIYSNEYQWDTCSDITKDIGVDIIHAYTPIPYEGQGSSSRLFEHRPQHIYEASENE